jgi:hypothetical protein
MRLERLVSIGRAEIDGGRELPANQLVGASRDTRSAKKSLSASSRKILKEGKPTMSKPKLEWAEKGEAEDFDAAEKFLSRESPGAR